MADSLYDTDILAWSEAQAELLRRVASGQWMNGVDWEHVVEEIADVGISQLNAVHGLLTQAMLHLLKIHMWPDDSARLHWQVELVAFLSSAAQRFAPSMRQRVDLSPVWHRARSTMARDIAATPLFKALPVDCPWSLDDLLAGDQDALLAVFAPTPPA